MFFKYLFDKRKLEAYLERIYGSLALGDEPVKYTCICREIDSGTYSLLREVYRDMVGGYGDVVRIAWLRSSKDELIIESAGKYAGLVLVNIVAGDEIKNYACIIRRSKMEQGESDGEEA